MPGGKQSKKRVTKILSSSEDDAFGGGLFPGKIEKQSSEDDRDKDGSFRVKKNRSSGEDDKDEGGSFRGKTENQSSEGDAVEGGSFRVKKNRSSSTGSREEKRDGGGEQELPAGVEEMEELTSFCCPRSMPRRTSYTLQEMQRLSSMMNKASSVSPSDGPTKMLYGSLFWAAHVNMTDKRSLFSILDLIETGIDQVPTDSPLSVVPSKMPLLMGWKFLIKCQRKTIFNFQREIGRTGNPHERVVKRFLLGYVKMKLAKMRAIVQMVKSPTKDQKELAKLFRYLVDMRSLGNKYKMC